MKLFLLMIFFVASAIYFSGGIEDFWEKQAPAKKISAVKPKFMHDKVSEVAADKPVYTFFETLNDVTMTRYVKLDGKVSPAILPPVKEPVETTPPVTKATPPEARVKPEVKPDRKAEVQTEPQPRYAVQVSSFRDVDRAEALKLRLQKKGFDAYLMQVELAGNAGTWHRVFLGKYADEEKAQEAARLAQSQHKLNAVVVRNMG
jgi:cell division septation protein DedD